MGNQGSGCCDCDYRPPIRETKNSYYTSFSDGSVKILDFADIFGDSMHLSDAKDKMRKFFPLEIRRIKDNFVNP